MTKTIEAIWQLLQQHQGETFHTAKGLPFTYTIRGGELFVNRRRKSITVSTVRRALEKITLLEAAGEVITGPKKIGCYGASYLYPVLLALDVLERPALPGQEEFTDAAIRILDQQDRPMVFLLWGRPAQMKKSMLHRNPKHLILEAPHPSPLSAYRGFFGCKHFSQTNEFLKANGLEPIDWQIENRAEQKTEE